MPERTDDNAERLKRLLRERGRDIVILESPAVPRPRVDRDAETIRMPIARPDDDE